MLIYKNIKKYNKIIKKKIIKIKKIKKIIKIKKIKIKQ
jgi:hypothetical protein